MHYHAQSNLYYAIVDIVDSLLAMSMHEAATIFHRQLKNELYLCVYQEPIAFLNEVARFGYPNIEQNNVRPFLEYLEEVVRIRQTAESCLDEIEGLMLEILRQMLKAASKEKVLMFLEGNKDGFLVEGFSSHYTTTCMMLPNATHFFDKETHISMEFAKPMGNYTFVDSKDDPLIQLSDVWVGFLSRLFFFLDDWLRDPVIPKAWFLKSQGMENLRTAKRLIERSNDLHRSLISNMHADVTVRGREKALSFLGSL